MNRLPFHLMVMTLTVITNTATAGVITVSTQFSSIPNIASIEAHLGTIGDGSPPVAIIDNLSLSGTAVIDVNLDNTGSGTLQLLSTNLVVSDIPKTTLTLASAGTLDLTATGLTLDLKTGSIPVSNNIFTVDKNTPGSLDAVAGHLEFSNPTGLLATLLAGGISYDFGASPLAGPFYISNPHVTGSVFNEPNQTLLNVGNPQFTIDTQLYAYSYPIGYLHYTLQIQLATAVPELSSFTLLSAIVCITIAFFAYRRRLAK